jgi:hypothetical protein
MLAVVQDLGPQLSNITAGGLAALMLASLFTLLRFQRRDRRDAGKALLLQKRQHDRDMDIVYYRLECAELHVAHCDRNFALLSGAHVADGGTVPPDLMRPPPLPNRPDPRTVPWKLDPTGEEDVA